jgi:surfactin synthase thioesterase subunit
VVLNFTDATDYLQRNAFVLVNLLQQIQGIVGPQTTVALAGASMGGLVSRYALAYMETNGLPPRCARSSRSTCPTWAPTFRSGSSTG